MNLDWSSSETRTLVLIFGALLVGSAIRLVLSTRADPQKARSRRASLMTWWALASLMAVAVILGRPGICLLLAVASWAGLREWARLVVKTPADRVSLWMLYALIPVTYGAIWIGSGRWLVPFVPAAALILVSTVQVVHGRTDGYLRATGTLVLGALALVFALSHAALLMDPPVGDDRLVSGAGLFLFLVLLTELNDIAQALTGRRLGKHKITPRVSPNKTWEGLAGGAVATLAASWVLAPWLTPLADSGRSLWPLLAGTVIVLSGFLGDLNMSAVKRDLGVKDSSAALPGMGGVLDRMDSLTFTAPCFYWLILVPAL